MLIDFFQTHRIENQTKKDMMKNVTKFSLLNDHETADMCVVIILSHGKEGAVISREGDGVSVAKIIGKFDSSNCQALIGKPKLFIFQACR